MRALCPALHGEQYTQLCAHYSQHRTCGADHYTQAGVRKAKKREKLQDGDTVIIWTHTFESHLGAIALTGKTELSHFYENAVMSLHLYLRWCAMDGFRNASVQFDSGN